MGGRRSGYSSFRLLFPYFISAMIRLLELTFLEAETNLVCVLHLVCFTLHLA